MTESRWTPPRPDCPHPEWWHSEDDESTETEVAQLVAAFVRALQPELVVESGTAFGVTAELIGASLADNGHGYLWTYEIDPARVEAATARCRGLPVFVHAQPFGPPFPDQIDFAWIDGHIEQRVADLVRARAWLRPGALVGVHDSGPQHGIRDAVEAVDWVRWVNLRTPRGVMFGEVIA